MSVILTISGFSGASGFDPESGFVTDASGDLIGVTGSGGANNAGEVFEIPSSASGYGPVTVLANFNGANGARPVDGLIADANGDLFGVTVAGGANNLGAVFEIPKTDSGYGPITVLYSFADPTTGPDSGLFLDANGDLIGETPQRVYEIVNSPLGYAFIGIEYLAYFYNSINYSIGSDPIGGLTADANGYLFGTTYGSGDTNGYGTVFEIPTNGGPPDYAGPIFIATFNGSDGAGPEAGVIVGANGDLFGTTTAGGANGYGTVFELSPSGVDVNYVGYGPVNVLANFNGVDSAGSNSLTTDANGDLFWVAAEGGSFGSSSIYEIKNTGSGYGPITLVASSYGANFVYVAGNITINSGESVTFYGGSVSEITINSGGSASFEGDASGNMTINSGGHAKFYSGSTVSTTINPGGELDVYSNGVASGAVINGDSAPSTTPIVGGGLVVYSGGAVSGTIVNGGGDLTIDAGGWASETTLSGDPQEIQSGGQTYFEGGYASEDVSGTAISTIINSAAAQHLGYGGVASATTINNGGAQFVYGGTAFATTVNSGGWQAVTSGVAVGTVIENGGEQTVEGGTQVAYDGHYVTATFSGSTISTTVESGGIQSIVGGSASDAVIADGGYVFLDGGTLELLDGSAAAGTIDFANGGGPGFASGSIGPATAALKVDGVAMPSAVISGFAPGDTIDLAGVDYDPTSGSATLGAGNVLEVTENGSTYDLQFDPTQIFTAGFKLSSDGSGGTDIQTLETAEPVETLGGPYDAYENVTIALTGMSVSASPNANDPLITVLSVTSGTISIGGGPGLTSATLSGTAAQINSDLAEVTYTPAPAASSFTDFLTMATTDAADGVSVRGVAAILVELADTTAPSQTLGGPYSGNENNTIALTGLSVSASSNSSDPLATLLSVSDGTISAGGQTGATVILSGTAAQIDAELEAATYAPDTSFYGVDTLSMTTTDTIDAQQVISSTTINVEQPASPEWLRPVGTPSQVNVSPTGVFLLGLSQDAIFYDTTSDVTTTIGPTQIYARALNPSTGAPSGPEVTLNLPTPPAGQVNAPLQYGDAQVEALTDGSFLALVETTPTPTSSSSSATPQNWALDRFSSTGAFIATLNSGTFSNGLYTPVSFAVRPDGNYDLVTESQVTTNGTETLTATNTTYTPTGATVASSTVASVSFSATSQSAELSASEYFSAAGSSSFDEITSALLNSSSFLPASNTVTVTLPWSASPTVYQAAASTTAVTQEVIGVGGGFEADGSILYGILNLSFGGSGSSGILNVYRAAYDSQTQSTTTTQLFSMASTSAASLGSVSVLSNGDIDVDTENITSTTAYPQYNSTIYSSNGQLLGSVPGLVTTTSSGGLLDTYAQNGNSYTQPLQYYKSGVNDDFSGSGVSDILLQNGGGTMVDWIVSNGAIAAGNNLGTNPGWNPVGTGDFTGNGTSDILMQDSAGTIVDWTMQNGTVSNAAVLGNSVGFNVVGTGDFTGTGTDDILLQNSAGTVVDWIVNNGAIAAGNNLGTNPGWNVVGTGDFNGDGASDALLENSAGTVVDWTMSNGTVASAAVIGNAGDYNIVGTGDFTGSGTADILLQNAAGDIVDWIMSNGAIATAHDLGVNPGWTVAAIGDYTGNGVSDILLTNSAGNVVDWTMQNGVVSNGALIGNSVGFTVKH